MQIGATPVKVWIDGILQVPVPPKKGDIPGEVIVGKGKEGREWREVPHVPNWDEERKRAIEWEGLPPLEAVKKDEKVVFTNVRDVWTRRADGTVGKSFSARSDSVDDSDMGVVLVENGKITCAGTATTCVPTSYTSSSNVVDLHGGSISPGLMSFGSRLGLEEIAYELSTGDGTQYNPFVKNIPEILGDVSGVLKAMDALQFATRDAL